MPFSGFPSSRSFPSQIPSSMGTTSLLRVSPSPRGGASLHPRHHLSHRKTAIPIHTRNSRSFLTISSCSVQDNAISSLQLQHKAVDEETSSTLLLDVSGMMCGACATRVKSIISSDGRVDSVVVNMLTETAAIKLRKGWREESLLVAEELAEKVSARGFAARRRVSGMGIEAKVRKWREKVEKKEEMVAKSRNRVAFAWTLVAVCCGSHASHILHSRGIHVAHGEDTVWFGCFSV